MKIVNPEWNFEDRELPIDGPAILRHIERIARRCYKSEGLITADSAPKMIRKLIDREHDAMIEHVAISWFMITDRGVSHELVRHRLAAYAQESTRFCNYSQDRFGNEIAVILPVRFQSLSSDFLTDLKIQESDYLLDASLTKRYRRWNRACRCAEEEYFGLLEDGDKPEEARGVLPTDLKTEIVSTMNLREMRHLFKMRCSPKAHPHMRQLMLIGLQKCYERIPVVFDDLYEKYFPRQEEMV